MNYKLIVITHGADPHVLNRTLQSFHACVQPVPASAYLHADGKEATARSYDAARRHDWVRWTLGQEDDSKGFCASVRESWGEAVSGDHDYVFWLEHDFVFRRGVNLEQLAAAIEVEARLAQMALMRDAVNEQEKAAGGLFESRPGQYEPAFLGDSPLADDGSFTRPPEYHVHSAYFTTNPNLMRRTFMVDNPWPGYESECEGRFGIDLVSKGYEFGVWGDGSAWVEHIGERTGKGY